MDFSSGWKKLDASPEQVFDFIADLRNVGELMPEQVVNWQADADRCSFTIKGMASLNMRVDERRHPQLLRLVADGKTPFEFELIVHLRPLNKLTEVMVELQAELNAMMALMVKRPMQHLVNHIADKLTQQPF